MLEFITGRTSSSFRRNFTIAALIIIGLLMMFHAQFLLQLKYVKFPTLTWMRIFGGLIILIGIMAKDRSING